MKLNLPLLRALRMYYDAYGVLPSYSMMAELCECSAKSWISESVKRLEAARFLGRTPAGQLMPGRLFFHDEGTA